MTELLVGVARPFRCWKGWGFRRSKSWTLEAFQRLDARGSRLEQMLVCRAAGLALFQFLISSLQPLVLSSTSFLLTIGNSCAMLRAVVRSP